MRKLFIAALAALAFAGIVHAQSMTIYWYGYTSNNCTGFHATIYDEELLVTWLESGIILSFRPVVYGKPGGCFKDIADSEGTQ